MSDDTTAATSVTPLTQSVQPDATECNQMQPNATPCNRMQPNATTVASSEIDATTFDDGAYDSQPPAACNQKSDSDLFTLSPQQEIALDLLLRGIPTPRIAQHLGVHRVTVFRWKTSHPRFIAELAHRARSSQFETALRARKTIDIANRIVLKQLIREPESSADLAARILASPRLARLASIDTPAGPDLLTQLQSARHCPDDADPAFLRELSDEINAPITPDQTAPLTSSTHRYANRQPRQCLVDAIAHYEKITQNDITRAIVRRPDFHPIDIHYTLLRDLTPWPPRMPLLAELLRDGPIGIHSTLEPRFISCGLIIKEIIHHVAGYSLEEYECNYDHENGGLRLTHKKDKTTIHLPQDQLWRDVIIPQ